MNNITKIVLTGGPCAGKTTALVKITEHFTGLGYKVFTIPEMPTLMSQAGMNYLTKNEDFFYEGEKATLQLQLDIEDKFTRMAETISRPVLIVCDRGAMDISAYMNPGLWAKITAECGTSSSELREKRYDAVLHLVSAADGAEQFYTTANNSERTEGIQLAREIDKKVINAWTGHPLLKVINNHENFDNKIFRVIKEISSILGLPQPIVDEHRYIVNLVGNLPEGCMTSQITQTYLVSEPGSQIRLRRRVDNGKIANTLTVKKLLKNNEMVETDRTINNNLYESMLQQADPYRNKIYKERHSFIYHGQYFELDNYHKPVNDLMILETKGIIGKENVKFPDFIKVIKDITGIKTYDNYNIALKERQI